MEAEEHIEGVGFVFCLIQVDGMGFKFLTNVLCACSNRLGNGGAMIFILCEKWGVIWGGGGWAGRHNLRFVFKWRSPVLSALGQLCWENTPHWLSRPQGMDGSDGVIGHDMTRRGEGLCVLLM